MINPFSILTSKIFAGVAVFAIAGLTVQTVRIEGALCRSVKVGEKPACIVQGFKQQVATLRIDLDQVKRDRDAERQRAETEAANHRQTKLDYQHAQADAARLEAERLARVAAQQKEINDEEVQDYRRRIAAARADAARAASGRLRPPGAQAGAGAAGAGSGVAVPGVPDAAGRADATAGDSQFPPDGFDLGRRLIATEQAIQLDKLIDVILKQHAVDPNERSRPN